MVDKERLINYSISLGLNVNEMEFGRTADDDCLYGFAKKEGSNKIRIVALSCSHTYLLTIENQSMTIHPDSATSMEIKQKNIPSLKSVTVVNVAQQTRYNKLFHDEGFYPYLTPEAKLPISRPFTYETRVYLKKTIPTKVIHLQFSKATGVCSWFKDENGTSHRVNPTELNSVIPYINKGKIAVAATYHLEFTNCGIEPEWIPNWNDCRLAEQDRLDLDIMSDTETEIIDD